MNDNRSGSRSALQRGVVHHAADRVVGAEVAVGFLVDAVGVLGAQHDARAALVGLQLVQRALELPALVSRARRALRAGACVGVEDRVSSR